MASFPHHHFQQYLGQQPPQPQQSKPFSELYNNMEGQSSQQVPYFNNPNLSDHHPPYVPPFLVAGLAPGPVQEENGQDLQWNFGLEGTKKRPKEQDFLENKTRLNSSSSSSNNNNNNNNNSQVSSLDFFQARSVSTGLGLSLHDPNPRLSSSDDSPLLGLGLRDSNLEHELQRHDAEIDSYLKIQGEQLRQAIIEKVQANQLRTISYIEEKMLQKLREKEAEVEDINKKNMELESRIGQIVMEANAWQQRAKYNEEMINTLKYNLQQVYAQSRDSKEGCGDSEVDDTASCCNGCATDFHLLGKESKQLMTCKACGVNRVSMLLVPCNHLCLCKECEPKLSFCPLCQSMKYIGMEVYM